MASNSKSPGGSEEHREWPHSSVSAFKQLFLEYNLERVLRRKVTRHRRVIADDTTTILLVSYRT